MMAPPMVLETRQIQNVVVAIAPTIMSSTKLKSRRQLLPVLFGRRIQAGPSLANGDLAIES